MRVRSDLWVAALIRRAFAAGATAGVVHHGADEAGAIFVALDRLDGAADLWGPAPQSDFTETSSGDRRFERLVGRVTRADVLARIASERRFDPDLWLVEVEDRLGRHFIEPPPADPDAVSPARPVWPPKLDD
ncbi:MAG: DUF1491 family protein [Siculibacillus sp.]|nr:DUF1491 family protein [Siculibacillus sp.]